MIFKANPKEKVDNLEVLTDLRIAEKVNKKQFYIYNIPHTPSWTSKNYQVQSFQCNPYSLKCNCEDYAERAEAYSDPRDFRRLCIHLYWKLTSDNIKQHISNLTKYIVEASVKFNQTRLIKKEFTIKGNVNDFIIGYTEKSEWINIYYKGCHSDYLNYGYNLFDKRWKRGNIPNNHQSILYFVDRLFTVKSVVNRSD